MCVDDIGGCWRHSVVIAVCAINLVLRKDFIESVKENKNKYKKWRVLYYNFRSDVSHFRYTKNILLYLLIVIQVLAHLQAQLQRHAGPEDLRASISCSLIPAKLIASLFIKYKR